MNSDLKTESSTKYSPFAQLILARLREFAREPEAVFWVYGFPILMVLGLGIAFRNQQVDAVTVDIEASEQAQAIAQSLSPQGKFVTRIVSPEQSRVNLRTGRTDLVIRASDTNSTGYEFWFDSSRPSSVLAHGAVDDALQRAAGRKDLVSIVVHPFDEPGGRYIDFLVPGLLGMSLMGGGLWGVGFVTVDMRIRKLLKRFLATPMRKGHFLGGVMISRLIFMIPEVLILLLFSRFFFGVVIYGSLWAVLFLTLLGATTFAGIGLLVASRAKTVETVSGLMNVVMLPMWLLSGIFFSSDKFPEAAQPFIRALPLTALNDSLRAVMQEGATLASQWPEVGIMTAWTVVSFAIAIRIFRWI